MPTDRTQLLEERVEALAQVLADEGIAPDHVEALRETKGIGAAAEVAQAHRNGNAPPDVGGGA